MNNEKCITCGKEAWPTCKQCANYWEVESRLEEYLKSVKGRKFVVDCLKKIEIERASK